MFRNIFNKNKENNWMKYNKQLKYFSTVPLLISNKTAANYYTNTKCCIDFHIYNKKNKRNLKLNTYHKNIKY